MATPLRVVLVEDSADDAELLVRELRRAGYEPAHERVETGAQLRAALRRGPWDLVISDHGLPSFSAPEALAVLQEEGLDVPFLIVSGAIGEETAVQAMRAGARDYIMKNNLARLAPAIVRELREAAARRERQQLEERYRQAQRLEAIGRLAGGVAHDFNNLLTVITSRTDFLRERLAGDEVGHREATLVFEAATRAAALTRQLLIFSRGQVLQPRVLDLNAIVADMELMLRRIIGERIELRTVVPAVLGRVKADQAQIEQVLMNLVVNAHDAMSSGGRLTVETADIELDETFCRSRVDSRPGPHVMLTVTDTGAGMDAETLTHLFEPFFTTKPPDQGTGLGLAVVYGIIKQSGGFIEVFSKPGRGTSVEVYLPRVDEALESTRARAFEGPLGGSETILLVDDHADVRAVAVDILRRRGYTVLEARDGGEALRILDKKAREIDLLLTDVVMPQMGGRELVRRVARTRPDMRVLYMSGFSEETTEDFTVLDAPFVEKPFTPAVLARKVREALNAPPPPR